MTDSAQSDGQLLPIGWRLLHQAHLDRKRVTICSEAALITHDQRGNTGMKPAGDWVGHVIAFEGSTDGTVTIGGYSFTTVIRWGDIRGAWLRDESPNPCICGREYADEPERAA